MIMIDWLVNKLLWYVPLRKEMFSDNKAFSIGSKFYYDIDGWRGWSKSVDIDRYYFNDIPVDSVIGTFKELELMEVRSMHREFDLDEIW